MSPTLLLDADIIAFKIASVSQREFRFDPENPTVVADDWSEVEPRIHHEIDKLKDGLKTDKVIVCLSCPTSENWRLGVLPTYKGNRDYSKRPVHLAAVKDYMEATWPSYRRPALEADDIMGILSTAPDLVKGDRIVVSEDKDLQCIPGYLYNPAKDSKPRLITEAQADRWHLYQTIVGDVVDGYTGCPGAGPVFAHTAETHSWVPSEHQITRGPRKGTVLTKWTPWDSAAFETPWERVVSVYRRFGLTEEDALTQARVARICRASDYDFKERKVILWTPSN